ncbi:MAG: polyketide cyclase [Tidjanibacter sp.]|nr:polyketide cyclase [Tidjanibacter sp.]
MEKYESKQQQIRRSAEQIYTLLSSFNNFTPMLQDKVEEWQADDDVCSFKVKGMAARLRMVEREPNKTIKIQGDDATPIDFTFWLQLKEVAPYDTRMRIVVHAELNMMMRMMIGKKLQGAVDQMAESIAAALNA